MDTRSFSRMIGYAAGIAIIGITAGVWFYQHQFHPMGSQFAGNWARQCLLYGRLAGLMMALMLLFQLLSMGKGRDLELLWPKLKLVKWHRWVGFTTGILLLLHIGLVVAGHSAVIQIAWYKQLKVLLFDLNGTRLAGIAGVLLLMVLSCCWLMLRKRMAYKKWKLSHYLTYLVVLLAFFHQISFGSDFTNHLWFKIFWIALFALTWLDVAIWKIRLRLPA